VNRSLVVGRDRDGEFRSGLGEGLPFGLAVPMAVQLVQLYAESQPVPHPVAHRERVRAAESGERDIFVARVLVPRLS
jgi:hypothetical protein